MEKELENPRKKKKPFQPKPAHQAQPRARLPPLTGGPHLSVPVSCACPLSLTHYPKGPICRHRFPSPARSLSLSLSRGPGSPVAEPLPRASPFLSLRRGPVLSVPPSSRSPWIGACALAHAAGFLDHDARPRAQLSSYSPAGAPHTPLTSFRTLSPSLALYPRRQPPSETRTHVPGHPARRRPLQASPSSALR
jgi:hypothetical protein